jgi:hypothetical protein
VVRLVVVRRFVDLERLRELAEERLRFVALRRRVPADRFFAFDRERDPDAYDFP